jgi:ABC-2 type transport system permease protein
MEQEPAYTLRVIWACLKKDIKSSLTERAFTFIGILTPLNAFLLLVLFVLGGSAAPAAVVMQDTGPYARTFYQALEDAHSFRLQQSSVSDANSMLQAGHIVSIITIPADFDQRIRQNQPVKVNVQINNLNTDFTNDIRHAIPLSITSFYSRAFPDVVTVIPKINNVYPQETDYLQYLSVSILVIGMLMGGILLAGTASAREWEKDTMKELLLSPASGWAIVLGKMLAAFVLNIISVGIVLLVLILAVGVHPIHWGEMLGFSALSIIIFIGWGTFLGTILKQRKLVVVLALGVSMPLFFLSGPLGPLSFSSPIMQIVAEIFPIYYSIVLQQHAFHNFVLTSYETSINAWILAGYALLMSLLAALVLRRSSVAH